MYDDIKRVAPIIGCELRKDLPFFGVCGVTVGVMIVVQPMLKGADVSSNNSWANALFTDFLSFHAFILLFLGLVGIAALASCFSAARLRLAALESIVTHTEKRLAQLSSSIISFTLGLAAISLSYATFTSTRGGVELASLILVLDCEIFVGFCFAAIATRRLLPTNQLWLNIAILFGIVSLVAWLLAYGGK